MEKSKAEQSHENQLIKELIAQLAQDKKALEEKNKWLQEKHKSITKKYKGNILILFSLCWSSRTKFSPSFLVAYSPYVHAELKTLLVTKEELVTDLKNLVYRRTDEMEKFRKMLKDADKYLVEALQQIKNMAEEKDLREKDLGELRAAAQAVVDMVDPPEESTQVDNTLLEQLQGALQKIMRYLSDTTRGYVSHVIGLVKSY